jgi:hypothetical protein
MVTLNTPNQQEYQALVAGLLTADLHVVADHIFEMRVSFNSNDWRAQAVEFRNCTFKQGLRFEHLICKPALGFADLCILAH